MAASSPPGSLICPTHYLPHVTCSNLSGLLTVADFVYFNALRDPDALISLVSSFRRGSTLVAFAGGVWLFHEPNWRQKLPAVIGVLIGIVLTVLG